MNQTVNKKVKNATTNEYDGIKFKSLLEARGYKLFKEAGFEHIYYESDKIILMDGFKPTVPFYVRNKKTKKLELNDNKLVHISYTPDLIITHNNTIFYIELKGMKTDSYNIKVKLFRNYLEIREKNRVFFELHSIKEIKEAIEIIKHYGEEKSI